MHAFGIDYSADAIALAEKALEKQPVEIKKNIKLIQLDSKKIAFPEGTFDCIFLLDFAEHLYPEEFDLVLSNAFFYLKKGAE